jgi:formyl-CoA transferase
MVRAPWRFDGVRPERSAHTAFVGEHTREVLREICSDQQLDALFASGDIVATGPLNRV